jgi:acylphosphatase
MTARRIVHVIVRGDVQGVGFRAWTQHQAELHGLDGWVRNRRDGSVEAVIAGPNHAVEAMLQACRKGPGSGLVEEVRVSEAQDAMLGPEGLAGFAVRGTV